MTDKPYPADLYAGCPCSKCDQPVETITLNNGATVQVLTRMSLCPECGNKRCPGAMDHSAQSVIKFGLYADITI